MKNKAIHIIMALTLCVGAFLFPTAAYAANDTTPPTVRAWITGDLLHVEAHDDTGVEAAYINSARVNYRVDGSFDLLLRDYAGSDKTISVYAVDFAGNKSNVVELNNPYYTAPTATPTPAPVTPAPTPPAVTPKPTPKPAAPTPTPEPEPTPEPTQSAVPTEQEPFTPSGTGTVVDNVTEQNGKEFFTITTADDNTFYLIIDRQRDSENVYLLNAVTEDDLAALAEKSENGGNSQSAIPTPEPKPTPEPAPTPEPEPEPPAKEQGNGGMILIILLVVAGAGGAGYYFKILKPRQEAAASPDSFEDEDEDDEDMEYEDEPDYPDYPDYPDTEEYPEDSGEPETDEE